MTESSGKELLIAQISESQCCQDLDTCALLATPTKRSKVKRISEKVHKLHHIHIKEMLQNNQIQIVRGGAIPLENGELLHEMR